MVIDPDLFFAATQVAGISIACLAALLALSQRGARPLKATLVLFFVALALSEAESVAEIVMHEMPQTFGDTLRAFSFACNFFVAPLFLFHVRFLTGASRASSHRYGLHAHFALPMLAIAVSLWFLALPEDLRAQMNEGVQFEVLPIGAQAVVLSLIALEFLIYIQWLVYVVWVFRQQVRHLARLKQHFASTDGLEMRWVTVLSSVLGLYSLLSLAGFVLSIMGLEDPIGRELDSSLVLVLVILLALWGLRPSVGFEEASRTIANSDEGRASKYEKSALALDQADRIARKLVAAMSRDRLYRDPTLTLASLSKHVGVSTNYVSQTLNEHLGQSFFDFVNGWRVQEAIPLVEQSDQTVLSIAYEVGFNSRSSFYTAFRKKTGLTPSAFKAKQAVSRSVQL
ncbi:helix-turn-helix domain-containing protein [Tateyamaria sp. SN3-11]|uniref:helix-turn-helix domain-containing protein n=1 Tax=Tateyamaria sp. SN3-11 TaxID=3092147 RepID=UPI0039E96FB3